MDWRDEGAVLSMRPHGESAAIIEVFTRGHGRHAGVVRGGASRRMAAVVQPGTQVDVVWRARLDDQIGSYTVEPLQSRAGLMADRLALAGLNAICAMLHAALPERESHPTLYRHSIALLNALQSAGWPPDYLRWELALLEELGFALDLTRCAITGSREDLAYVSPKTGRAVSREMAAGQPWERHLLPLPPFLLSGTAPEAPEIAPALQLSAHFLARHWLRGDRLEQLRERAVGTAGAGG